MSSFEYKIGSLVQCPITAVLGVIVDVKVGKYNTKYHIHWQDDSMNSRTGIWTHHYEIIFVSDFEDLKEAKKEKFSPIRIEDC